MIILRELSTIMTRAQVEIRDMKYFGEDKGAVKSFDGSQGGGGIKTF